MKKIIAFLKWLFGYGTPNIEETSELVSKEVEQLKNIEKSVKEMKVIHDVISEKIEKSSKTKRLTRAEIRDFFVNEKQISVKGLSRKEKQYIARKIFDLKTKKNMKIVFDKTTKSYKYYPNGL
jgi:hypothetical protein